MSWQPKSTLPPPGYRYGPRYPISREIIVRAAAYIALGRKRSLARDALITIAAMPRPPLVRGQDRVPETGALVIVANHYERPGLWMAWPAMYASHLVRERTGLDTHWIAIREWETFRLWGLSIPRNMLRFVFERGFRVYGIIAMPPPDAPAAARATSLRAAVQVIKKGEVVGLMPEGTVGDTPELLEAREGAGTFVLLLSAAGARILPLGLYEENDRLVAHFGEPFVLALPPDCPSADRDRWARERVMQAVKELLPASLWGIYRVAGDDDSDGTPPEHLTPTSIEGTGLSDLGPRAL